MKTNGLSAAVRTAVAAHTDTGRTVSVDLGERDILVLQFKHILNPNQRETIRQAMELVAKQPGRQTLILEDGCEYSIIRRDAPAEAA